MFGRGEWSRGRGFRSRGRGRSDGPPDSKYRKTYNVSDEVEDQVRELFQKKYQFDKSHWALPDPSQIFQDSRNEVPELFQIKQTLNKAKSELDNKDILSWQRHTKFTNRAAAIIPAIRKQFDPELCTQGWTKFHEILTTYNIVPDSSIRLSTLHLCEAPGAFITSLNHYLKTHRRDVMWQWKAMTLNPYYEGNDLRALIDQDRFMMETNDRWFLGIDNSGDITNWDNVTALVSTVKKDFNEVNLVTADGSVDCSNYPGEQEDIVAQLLFCETVTALMVLRDEGTFVLKTFTTLECQTISLMYLLAATFKEVNVYKPVTSKGGNSEQYVICIGYKGKGILTEAYWDKLKLGFGMTFSDRAVFPIRSIPQSFLSQLAQCTSKFSNYQMNVIKENIQLYICMKFSERKLIQDVREHCCKEFLDRCKLKKLPRDKAILPRIHLDGLHGLYTVVPLNHTIPDAILERKTIGSLATRLDKLQQPWSSMIKNQETGHVTLSGVRPLPSKSGLSESLKLVLHHFGYSGSGLYDDSVSGNDMIINGYDIESDDVQWLRARYSQKSIEKQDLESLDGKRVEKVTYSRFCRNDTLKKLTDIVDKAQIIQSSQMSDFSYISSKWIPCHALLSRDPPFFLNSEGLNLAAIDLLTGVINKISATDDQPLSFVDLWGAPSNYGQYIYWIKSNQSIKGWGVVRSDRPSMRPSSTLARLVQWDSFQILGSVQGLNITNNDTINSIVAAVESDNVGGVKLVLGDMSSLPFGAHSPGTEENHTKQQFLSQCICALKLLSKNGSFVCRVYSLLTRFSAGLVYLLYRVFQEVALIKPVTSSPASCEQFIVCRGFNGCPSIVCDLLLEVNNHLSDLNLHRGYGVRSASTDVLEIIPVQLLFEESFHQYLSMSNEKMAKLQTKTILQLEKYFIEPETLPSDDDIETKLQTGLLELLKLSDDSIHL